LINEKLPAEIPTVAELLAEEGYGTHLLTNSPNLGQLTGLDRGFDEVRHFLRSDGSKLGYLNNYPDAFYNHAKDLLHKPQNIQYSGLKEGMISRLQISNMKKITQDASQKESPFFIYTHVGSPHLPYDPPAKYIDAFTDEIENSKGKSLQVAKEKYASLDVMRENIANECEFSEETWESIVAMYDAEIRFMDEYISGFIHWLLDQNIEDLVIVVTADHGDLFGENGVMAHKILLHDGLVRVPLLLHGLDVDIQDSPTVQHIDIMKTILDTTEVDTSQLQGKNLADTKRKYAFTQRNEFQIIDEYLKYNEGFRDRGFHEGQTTSIRSKEHKLVKSEDQTKFYEITSDGEEIVQNENEVMVKMDGILEEWIEQYSNPVNSNESEEEISEEMEKQLEYLGYK